MRVFLEQFFDAGVQLVQLCQDFVLSLVQFVQQRRRCGSFRHKPGESPGGLEDSGGSQNHLRRRCFPIGCPKHDGSPCRMKCLGCGLRKLGNGRATFPRVPILRLGAPGPGRHHPCPRPQQVNNSRFIRHGGQQPLQEQRPYGT